jgi:hypothetical protein
VRQRGLSILLLAASPVALLGCVTLGEQQFWFSAQNDSPETLIIQFEWWLPQVIVEGGRGGYATSFGAATGPVIVMDDECRILATFEVTSENNRLWVRPDGSMRLNAQELGFRPAEPVFTTTEACDVQRPDQTGVGAERDPDVATVEAG